MACLAEDLGHLYNVKCGRHIPHFNPRAAQVMHLEEELAAASEQVRGM